MMPLHASACCCRSTTCEGLLSVLPEYAEVQIIYTRGQQIVIGNVIATSTTSATWDLVMRKYVPPNPTAPNVGDMWCIGGSFSFAMSGTSSRWSPADACFFPCGTIRTTVQEQWNASGTMQFLPPNRAWTGSGPPNLLAEIPRIACWRCGPGCDDINYYCLQNTATQEFSIQIQRWDQFGNPIGPSTRSGVFENNALSAMRGQPLNNAFGQHRFNGAAQSQLPKLTKSCFIFPNPLSCSNCELNPCEEQPPDLGKCSLADPLGPCNVNPHDSGYLRECGFYPNDQVCAEVFCQPVFNQPPTNVCACGFCYPPIPPDMCNSLGLIPGHSTSSWESHVSILA